MKGESGPLPRRGGLSPEAAQTVALDVFQRLAADPERLGRFLALSGLDPRSIRQAAAEPGFLPAILEHVAGDEALLVAMANELGLPPERLAEARHRLAPEADGAP